MSSSDVCHVRVENGKVAMPDGEDIPEFHVLRSAVLSCMVEQGDGIAALPATEADVRHWIGATRGWPVWRYQGSWDQVLQNMCTALKV